MTNILNRLKDYFGYSRSERVGILILFIILLLTILINILLPFIIKPEETDFSEFKEMIETFEKRQSEIEDSINNLKQSNTFTKNNTNFLTPFYFDPNNMTITRWEKLGLNNWQIEVIDNYIQKGGKFYSPKDLAKMYSISDEEYKILEPYIVIESNTKNEKKSDISPFAFDPNSISKKELEKMNMRDNLINTILNYREKGGRFYSKEDFKKLYTITDEEFSILEPFIILEKDTLQIDYIPKRFSDSLLIDLNTADSLDLQQLIGIGPSFSKRIIKYRELLGGYCDKNQLLEVYGMDNARFDGIKSQIIINYDLVIKININKATIKEMIKHPYIEFYVAKSIITHRNEVGSFKNLHEIKNAKLIYEELYQKIVPYLTTN